MPRKREAKTVEAFGPEIFEALLAQTTLRIAWGKEAGYEQTPEKRNTQNVRFPVNRATPAKLIISPADSEFGDALKKAGITLRPLSPVSEGPSAKPVMDDILEQFLKDGEV